MNPEQLITAGVNQVLNAGVPMNFEGEDALVATSGYCQAAIENDVLEYTLNMADTGAESQKEYEPCPIIAYGDHPDYASYVFLGRKILLSRKAMANAWTPDAALKVVNEVLWSFGRFWLPPKNFMQEAEKLQEYIRTQAKCAMMADDYTNKAYDQSQWITTATSTNKLIYAYGNATTATNSYITVTSSGTCGTSQPIHVTTAKVEEAVIDTHAPYKNDKRLYALLKAIDNQAASIARLRVAENQFSERVAEVKAMDIGEMIEDAAKVAKERLAREALAWMIENHYLQVADRNNAIMLTTIAKRVTQDIYDPVNRFVRYRLKVGNLPAWSSHNVNYDYHMINTSYGDYVQKALKFNTDNAINTFVNDSMNTLSNATLRIKAAAAYPYGAADYSLKRNFVTKEGMDLLKTIATKDTDPPNDAKDAVSLLSHALMPRSLASSQPASELVPLVPKAFGLKAETDNETT